MDSQCRIPRYRGWSHYGFTMQNIKIPRLKSFWFHNAEYRDTEVSHDGFTMQKKYWYTEVSHDGFTMQNTGIPRFHMMDSQFKLPGYRGWSHDGFRNQDLQYNIFLFFYKNTRWLSKQPISLFVHLMEPSASQPNSSVKRLDLWRNDTVKAASDWCSGVLVLLVISQSWGDKNSNWRGKYEYLPRMRFLSYSLPSLTSTSMFTYKYTIHM